MIKVSPVVLVLVMFLASGCAQRTESAAQSNPRPPHFGVFLFAPDGELLNLPEREDMLGAAHSPTLGKFPSRLIVYPEPGWNLSARSLVRVKGFKESLTYGTARTRVMETRLVEIGEGFYEVVPTEKFEPGAVYAFIITGFPYGILKAFALY